MVNVQMVKKENSHMTQRYKNTATFHIAILDFKFYDVVLSTVFFYRLVLWNFCAITNFGSIGLYFSFKIKLDSFLMETYL